MASRSKRSGGTYAPVRSPKKPRKTLDTTFLFPEGLIVKPNGISFRPEYDRLMKRIWDRSSVVWFSQWDPPRKSDGSGGPRWFNYYPKIIRQDVRSGRLTKIEGELLREYLDIIGT